MAAALVTRLPSSTSSTPSPRKGALDGHVERPNSFREGLHYASARRRRQQSGHGQKEGQTSTEATHPVPAAGIPSVIEAKPRILQFHDDKVSILSLLPNYSPIYDYAKLSCLFHSLILVLHSKFKNSVIKIANVISSIGLSLVSCSGFYEMENTRKNS